MAYLMAEDPSLGPDPAALKAKLLSTARKGAISGTALAGDAKLLLSNGADGKLAVRSTEEEKRTVTGSMASWAKELVGSAVDRRWKLHSTVPSLRF
jgi:cerevisin